MSRNRLYSLASAVLAAAAVVVAIVAVVRGELGGLAAILALGAGGAALLRIRSRIRSESRHRWALQARIGALETALRECQVTAREQVHEIETMLSNVEYDASKDQDDAERSATYTQLALLNDRVLALESSLHPVR